MHNNSETTVLKTNVCDKFLPSTNFLIDYTKVFSGNVLLRNSHHEIVKKSEFLSFYAVSTEIELFLTVHFPEKFLAWKKNVF